MHMMVVNIVRTHRLKRASPHMQSDKGNLRALGGYIRQHLIIKMQPRRRRRHCTQLVRINRLIATLIFLSIGTVYIRR